MVTKEQIKDVEKYQELKQRLSRLKEDYRNVWKLGYKDDYRFDTYYSNQQIKKAAKIYLSNAIRRTEREIKKMKGEII